MSINKDKEKSVIGSIFSAMLKGRDEEIKAAYGDIISEIAKREDLEDPDSLHLAFVYPYGDILEAALKTGGSELHNYRTLVTNKFTFDSILEKVIHHFQGTACVHDRSQWLIEGFIEYKKSGQLPDMAVGETEFWKPHFGKAEDWMELIESINSLLYGDYNRFMIALKALYEAGSDVYKEDEG